MEKELQNIAPQDTQIIFWGSDWQGHPTSSIHLAKGLIRQGFEIFWINSIGMRSPRLSLSDGKRILTKIGHLLNRSSHPPKTNNQDLLPQHQIHPFIIPFFGNALCRWLNKILISSQLKKKFGPFIRKEAKQILITTFPNSVDHINLFHPASKAYYVMDDFSHFPGVDHQAMMREEQKMFNQIDRVIFAADLLHQKFKQGNHKKTPSLTLTHGVDTEHFKKAFTEETRVPKDMPGEGINLGFIGLLDQRIDQDLLFKIAKHNPKWNIIIIGNHIVPINQLTSIPNIKVLGPKPYKLLPTYLRHFNLALMPYTRSKLTEGLNPLKMKEYLAAGRKIVTTKLDSTYSIKDIIFEAPSSDIFLDHINQALKSPAKPKVIAGHLEKKESWDTKSIELIKFTLRKD